MKIEFRRSEGMLSTMPEGTPEARVIECDEFVQLTYQELRLGPEGDSVALVDERGEWFIDGDPLAWSDVVISP